MVRFLLRRLVGSAGILVALSLLAYVLFYLAPGDPAAVIVAQQIGRLPTSEEIAAARAEYGLDQPLLVQYGAWAAKAVRGDLGYSIRSGLPVLEEIRVRIGPTLLLAAVTTALALVIGIPVGFLAAWRHNTFWDHVTRTGTLLSVSIPNFWLAFLLILVFSIYLHWLPSFGMKGPKYLILPVVSLGLANAGRLSRLTRSCLIEVLHQSYLRTARAKGLSERVVWLRHALPNITVPLLTVSVNQFGAVVASSVIIETLFAWPGIGNFYITSVHYRDIPAIQAMVLLFAVVFVLLNILCDATYAIVDPRIRLE